MTSGNVCMAAKIGGNGSFPSCSSADKMVLLWRVCNQGRQGLVVILLLRTNYDQSSSKQRGDPGQSGLSSFFACLVCVYFRRLNLVDTFGPGKLTKSNLNSVMLFIR